MGERRPSTAGIEPEAHIMATAADSKIVVATGATAHATQVHHKDFPEIRADGASPAEAAGHLINQLLRVRDSALTPSRLEQVDGAIADVKAFATQAG